MLLFAAQQLLCAVVYQLKPKSPISSALEEAVWGEMSLLLGTGGLLACLLWHCHSQHWALSLVLSTGL